MSQLMRRGQAAQQRANLARQAVAPLASNPIRETSCKVVGFSGIKGGEENKRSKKGGIWLKVSLPDGRKTDIWCGDSISTICGQIGVGNIIGKTVRCSYRGIGIEDFKNGVSRFVGSGVESYDHPDCDSPVSVGGFHGCNLDVASHRVFAGFTPGVKGEV